jgi:hypothetical protein
MKVLEFARSTLTFRVDWDRMAPRTFSHKPPYALNNARIQLESRLRVTERMSGRVHTFVLGASCKTERVGADVDLWLLPNADFMPIFSDTDFMHVKSFAQAGTKAQAYPPGSGEQSDRLRVPIATTFDGVRLDLVEHEGAHLADAREIVEATLANKPLVGVIAFEADRYIAVLEFPVKTMNANERDWVYQTDTGPILFPDLERDPNDLLSGMEVAFVALNAPDWADFIVRARTKLTPEVEVYHYSVPVRINEIRNEIYTFPPQSRPTERRVDLPVAEGGQGA